VLGVIARDQLKGGQLATDVACIYPRDVTPAPRPPPCVGNIQ